MVVGSEYRCPHCGRTATYDKADHWFELVIER
jgi:hypothetical protein